MNKQKKRSYLGTCLVIFLIGAASAQSLVVQDKQITLEEGDDRHTVQLVCDQSVDVVRSAFDEYMEDYHDVRMNTGNLFGKHRVIEAENIQLDAVSDKEMNLYVRIIEQNDQTELSAFGSFGPDVFITNENYPEAYQEIDDLVRHFTSVFVPKYFRNNILDGREIIADIRDDVADAERDIARNNKKIERLKEENHELTEEIAGFNSDLENAEKELKQIKERRSVASRQVKELRRANH